MPRGPTKDRGYHCRRCQRPIRDDNQTGVCRFCRKLKRPLGRASLPGRVHSTQESPAVDLPIRRAKLPDLEERARAGLPLFD